MKIKNSSCKLFFCAIPTEPEEDSITCGDCQKDFRLNKILDFLHHKIYFCNKTNLESLNHGIEKLIRDEEIKHEEVFGIANNTRNNNEDVERTLLDEDGLETGKILNLFNLCFSINF